MLREYEPRTTERGAGIPIEWVLVLFYAGVGLVLIATGTSFGRRHRAVGLLGVACTLVASGAGVLTYMVLDR